MKNIALVCIACLAVALSGCSSSSSSPSLGSDISAFTASLPPNNVTDASLQVATPFWNHQVSVTTLAKAPDGSITVGNLKDNFAIPLWGVTKTFSVSGISVGAPAPAAPPK